MSALCKKINEDPLELLEFVTIPYSMIKPYEAFICSTWLKNLLNSNDLFSKINPAKYFKQYSPIVNRILQKPEVLINLVLLKDDNDVIIGYSVYEDDTLHWVYVKPKWRKVGIASKIVSKDIKKVTHLTKIGEDILNKHKLEFDPFL